MIKIEKVLERDIDLLVINKLVNDKRLIDYFMKKVELNDYELISIEHSYYDIELGETDITVIVKKDNKKVGLLIENKIDAPAMDLQPERYVQRGNKGIENRLYDDYKIFIIAPEQYLKTNNQANKYPNKISYEELKELMIDDEYAVALIDKAIEEQESGYVVIENEKVTKFWKSYYEFVKINYPKIKIHEIDGPRGANARWPEFKTDYPQVRIIHKANKGCMDLTFSKMADSINIFSNYISENILGECKIVETGKSLAIRIEVPPIDFKNEFSDYLDEMHICMDAALKLYDVLSKINILKMYNEI